MGRPPTSTPRLVAPSRPAPAPAPGRRAPVVGGEARRRRFGAALRVDRRRVKTAVWTLAHPATGRTVTLLGTMHIGDPAYFGQLSEVLAGLAEAGAEVHVEGISDGVAGPMSDWERDRLAEADGWANAETSGAAVALLQLESQGGKLRLPAGTRNIDLTYVELLRRVGWDDYRRLLAPQPELRVAPGLGPVVRAAMRFQLRHSRSLARLASLRPWARRVSEVVMGARNEIAYAGGLDALERGDVVLVWGTDHLPELAERFAAAGYRPRREQWFDACTI